MKKEVIFKIIAAVIAFYVLMKLGVFEALLLFLLAGAIPGLPFTLPSWIMLPIILASIVMFTRWVANKQLYPGSPKVKASQAAVLKDPALKQKRAKNAQLRRHYFNHLKQQAKNITTR